jgi:hypothetical protein
MPRARKYQPLVDYLNSFRGREVTFSFEELGAMVGPMSHGTRSWSYWTNGPFQATRPSRWIQSESGFDTYFQSTSQKVRFVRRKP